MWIISACDLFQPVDRAKFLANGEKTLCRELGVATFQRVPTIAVKAEHFISPKSPVTSLLQAGIKFYENWFEIFGEQEKR